MTDIDVISRAIGRVYPLAARHDAQEALARLAAEVERLKTMVAALDATLKTWQDYHERAVAEVERLRGKNEKLKRPQWFYNDGESIDDVNEYADLEGYEPGGVFSLESARDTGTHYFRVRADDSGGCVECDEITKEEYSAALASKP
jgi:hypothetical protein